jgi:NAD(P)-dependent dehydrogenase (short-subunit alcohol dehydrogenase family)
VSDTIRFDGQVAFITGSGRGLGFAYAQLLAERGAAVVIHDAGVTPEGTGSNHSVAAAAVEAIMALGGVTIPCYEDITSEQACQRAIQTALDAFGRLDILINNAGFVAYASLEDTDNDLLERMLAVQVKAPFWLSRAAFPHMRAQGYGRILLTTSGRATHREHALPELSAYAMGKMAQLGLMNTLAVAGEPYDIRVNAIAPVAATRMLRRPVAPHELRPEQVAPGAVFLVSSQCAESGLVLAASDGHFAVERWISGPGVNFGQTPATLEEVAGRWSEIMGQEERS